MGGNVRHAFPGLCQLTQQSVLLKRPVNISSDRTNHLVLASNLLVSTTMIHRPSASQVASKASVWTSNSIIRVVLSSTYPSIFGEFFTR
jgi:hypothetical protein